jgi:hypothetical protein
MQDILSFIHNRICPVCGNHAEIVDWSEGKETLNPFKWIVSCKNCNPEGSDYFYISQDAVYNIFDLDDEQKANIRENLKKSKSKDSFISAMNLDQYVKKDVKWQI